MTSIGELLRGAREQQGRSVADLAAELCITQRYVRAIEANDIEVLPGLFFFQSFARQYAAILGLDQGQVRRALEAIEPPAEPAEACGDAHGSPVRSPDPIVTATNRRYFAEFHAGLSAAGLVAAVLLGSGIFAWWTRPPQTPARSVSRPAAAVQPPQLQGTSTNNVPAAAAEAPVETAAANSDVSDEHQVVLNLSATEKTWLSITSGGKVIFSGILLPSESKTLKGTEVATMKVGNAGGVDIQWNGKSIGPIGPRGQVRTIRFTREDFQILSADGSPGEL